MHRAFGLLFVIASFVLPAAIVRAGERDCVFYEFGKPPKTTEIKNCAYKRKKGAWHIRSRYLKKIEFDENGLSSLMIGKSCYWLNKKFVLKQALCSDNSSDFFKDGFARYIGPNGKMGFMDQKLKVVVPAKYDFMFPFEDGVAMYCNGCKRKDDDVHGKIEGGKWGFVDKSGKEVSKQK